MCVNPRLEAPSPMDREQPSRPPLHRSYRKAPLLAKWGFPNFGIPFSALSVFNEDMEELCPICQRELIPGPSCEAHHLVPKSRKGAETVLLHAVCHRMIHKIFSESALVSFQGDLSPVIENAEMQRFIAWVRKKPAEFTDRPRTKGRRPYNKSR